MCEAPAQPPAGWLHTRVDKVQDGRRAFHLHNETSVVLLIKSASGWLGTDKASSPTPAKIKMLHVWLRDEDGGA